MPENSSKNIIPNGGVFCGDEFTMVESVKKKKQQMPKSHDSQYISPFIIICGYFKTYEWSDGPLLGPGLILFRRYTMDSIGLPSLKLTASLPRKKQGWAPLEIRRFLLVKHHLLAVSCRELI